LSGWIKLEKDLREDQRVKRMARGLNQVPAFCNAPALLCVTLVLGGLAQLWMHADSFARDDDTLDITPDEVDELTGIQGFSNLLPEDWFQVLDATRVKLPGFQDHNGSEAKRKALTARRVAQHRSKEKLQSVTTCDPPVTQVRYQTRPDQTILDQNKNPSASATPTRRTVPREADPDWFLDFKLAYPDRAGDQGWRKALRAANERIREGHAAAEFVAGAQRYAEFCRASGKVGTEFVKQACTFLGPDKHFLESWKPPATKADVRLAGNLAVAADFVRDGQ
jgi:hypothetical protein